jgi:hypothetical protein
MRLNASEEKLMAKSGVEHLAQHPGWKTRPKSKPYVLIVVSGGVAEVAKSSDAVDVDILDLDNLESTADSDAVLSDEEWAYLKDTDPDLYEFFAASREKAEQDY